jgi:outer membrane protein
MKPGNFRSVAGTLALLAASLPALGADLLSVFDLAVKNDPQIREADATRLAQREARPQAFSALLPQVSGSAGVTSSRSSIGPDPEWVSSDTLSLSLRQSVFSWQNWVALSSADYQVAQAEANYLVQQQQLAQRVAQQYFAVLQAQDTLRAQEAARDAFARQFEQAEQRFEVGLIAVTDVLEARAARDNASANVISAKRALASAAEQLRATIGELPGTLNGPAQSMPLLSPVPADQNAWVTLSMEQNAALISSRLAADIARDSTRSAFGGHLPSVDLSLSRNQDLTDGKPNNTSIALQLSVPIFSGGATSSRVRQSQYQWIAAKERLERTSRDTERQARDAYLGVISEIERVQAASQALESSRTALNATELGAEIGTRTTVDVLNSRQQLIQAETNYSVAKYSYLNNLIALRLASGSLDRKTLEELNAWLTVPPPAAPAGQ